MGSVVKNSQGSVWYVAVRLGAPRKTAAPWGYAGADALLQLQLQAYAPACTVTILAMEHAMEHALKIPTHAAP